MGWGIASRFCAADGGAGCVGETSGADRDLHGVGGGGVGDFGGVGSGDAGGGEIGGEEVVWDGWGEGAGRDGADDGGFCLGVGQSGGEFFCQEKPPGASDGGPGYEGVGTAA